MAKVVGYLPFWYYLVISSSCGGLSTIVPPVALFRDGRDQTAWSRRDYRVLLCSEKSTAGRADDASQSLNNRAV